MKPTWKRLLQLACLCLVVSPNFLIAQEEDIDYSEMSLEDLLNVEVVTASKTAESSWDAPAVITTVTKEEIKQFGAIQLRELLERVTGMTPNRADGFYFGQVLRGGDPNPDNANVHTLLLVNGRPIRESYNGSSNQIPFAVFPVNAIERIEIVRGPGSVLYGTNAFEGVINIITNKSNDNDITAFAAGGSDSGKNYGVTANYSKDDFHFHLAANVFEEDGPTTDTVSFDGTPQDPDNDFQDNMGIMATVSYKDFSINLYHGESDWNSISFGPGYFPLTETGETTMLDLGWNHEFNDKWSMQADITRNDFDFAFLFDTRYGLDPGQLIHREAQDTLYEVTAFGNLSDRVSVVFGGVYENISGGSKTDEIPDYDENRSSFYFQADYRPVDKIKLIAGGQYNKIENLDGDFVPRLGAIFKFNDSLGAKVLYGHAFRSPAKLQTDQVFGGFGPNPDLEPEKTKNSDLQLFWNKSNYQLAVTYFKNDEEKLIRVQENPDPNYDVFFDNTESREISGLEIEGKFVPSESWYILGSYVRNDSEGANGNKDVTLAPKSIAKLGANYRGKVFSIAAFYSRFDAFGDNIALFPDRVLANDVSEDWSSITMRAAVHFKFDRADMTFKIYGRNLQDDEVHTPNMEGAGTNTITYTLPAQWYAGVDVKF